MLLQSSNLSATSSSGIRLPWNASADFRSPPPPRAPLAIGSTMNFVLQPSTSTLCHDLITQVARNLTDQFDGFPRDEKFTYRHSRIEATYRCLNSSEWESKIRGLGANCVVDLSMRCRPISIRAFRPADQTICGFRRDSRMMCRPSGLPGLRGVRSKVIIEHWPGVGRSSSLTNRRALYVFGSDRRRIHDLPESVGPRPDNPNLPTHRTPSKTRLANPLTILRISKRIRCLRLRNRSLARHWATADQHESSWFI